jgi:hypothetical protein
MFLTAQLFSQKPKDEKFDKIFGCSCCADTLRDLKDASRIFVISDHRSEITCYKSGKEKWKTSIEDLYNFGDNNVGIECIEFYEVNKKVILRLFTNNEKQKRIDVDPKTGKRITNK